MRGRLKWLKQMQSWQRRRQSGQRICRWQRWKPVALREVELQKEVEIMNALTQTEKLKADFLSKASVEYETMVQEANWELYKKQKSAEVALYQNEKEAEAQKAMAEASFYALQQVADGELYEKQKEAEGLIALAQAQGTYMRTLLEALGENYANGRGLFDGQRANVSRNHQD